MATKPSCYHRIITLFWQVVSNGLVIMSVCFNCRRTLFPVFITRVHFCGAGVQLRRREGAESNKHPHNTRPLFILNTPIEVLCEACVKWRLAFSCHGVSYLCSFFFLYSSDPFHGVPSLLMESDKRFWSFHEVWRWNLSTQRHHVLESLTLMRSLSRCSISSTLKGIMKSNLLPPCDPLLYVLSSTLKGIMNPNPFHPRRLLYRVCVAHAWNFVWREEAKKWQTQNATATHSSRHAITTFLAMLCMMYLLCDSAVSSSLVL